MHATHYNFNEFLFFQNDCFPASSNIKFKIETFVKMFYTTSIRVSCGFQNASVEQNFVDELLSKITKHAPHANMTDNTVYLYIDLYQLLGVDEKQALVNLKLWFYLTYYIPDLAWDPEAIGVYSVIFPPGTVWTPDVIFHETVDIVFSVYENQQITSTGMVSAITSGLNIQLTCSFDVRLFPFDAQVSTFQRHFKSIFGFNWLSSRPTIMCPKVIKPTKQNFDKILVNKKCKSHWISFL